MAIVLGLLGSFFVGSGDFLGRVTTKRSNAITAVINAGIASFLTSLILVVLVPSTWLSAEFVRGAAAGSIMGLGLACLYHALSLTSASLVGPIVALLSAVVPVAFDMIETGLPEQLALIGIGVAIGGLALNGLRPEFTGQVRNGIYYSLLAGVLSGTSLVLAGTSSEESGMWPLVSQRFFLTLTLVTIGIWQHKPFLAPGNTKYLSALGGMLAGGLGLGLFVAGSQRGSLAQVTVAFSLFAGVTAVWAAIIDGERIRWWQTIGFGAVLAGVAMIGASQAV